MKTVTAYRIAERRTQLGMTQEELAIKLGWDHKKIWRYESGLNKPSLDALDALAGALQTSIDWLVGRSDHVSSPSKTDLSLLEQELIKIVRSKSADQQKKIVDIAKVV
jgi:transcriptional regulator with XRE-family HTH domain